MKRVLLAVVLAVFLLGACGDDSGSALDSASGGGSELNSDEQALADEISGELKSGEADDVPLTDEEAECVGNGMVGAVGYDKLSAIDFEADEVTFNLSPEDADKAAAVMVDCIDIQSTFAGAFSEDGTISEESSKCLAGKLDDDLMTTFFSQIFQGNDEEPPADFTRAITDGMSECLSDEELQNMGG